jgi:hypothetical protein
MPELDKTHRGGCRAGISHGGKKDNTNRALHVDEFVVCLCRDWFRRKWRWDAAQGCQVIIFNELKGIVIYQGNL